MRLGDGVNEMGRRYSANHAAFPIARIQQMVEEDGQNLVRADISTIGVNNPEAVSVAVVSQAQMGGPGLD